MAVELSAVAAEAQPYLDRVEAGPGLDRRQDALIRYAVATCATALDPDSIADTGEAALDAGADEELLVEVLVMVSAVGVHALHEGVIALERARPRIDPGGAARSSYWRRFDAELPGFSDGLAARSPWAFRAFAAFAGAPAQHGRLDRVDRELIYSAIDATPTHRYVPGLRFHLDNAVRLGATRTQLEQALAIAAGAPLHRGVGRHAPLARPTGPAS